jgi:hypothetical protein
VGLLRVIRGVLTAHALGFSIEETIPKKVRVCSCGKKGWSKIPTNRIYICQGCAPRTRRDRARCCDCGKELAKSSGKPLRCKRCEGATRKKIRPTGITKNSWDCTRCGSQDRYPCGSCVPCTRARAAAHRAQLRAAAK